MTFVIYTLSEPSVLHLETISVFFIYNQYITNNDWQMR